MISWWMFLSLVLMRGLGLTGTIQVLSAGAGGSPTMRGTVENEECSGGGLCDHNAGEGL